MGLETIPTDAKPDTLNNSWPLTGDAKKEGDNHIRNIKTVLKNFYTDFVASKNKIEGYFSIDGKAKHAINSTKLGGETATQIRDATKLTGVASADRFPTATVLEPGVLQLSSTLADDETKAATPKLVKQVSDQIAAGVSTSDVVGWQSIAVGAGKLVAFSTELKAMLTAGSIVEVRLVYKKVPYGQPGGDYYSITLFLDGTLLAQALPYLPVYDSRFGADWKIHGVGMATQKESFIAVSAECTFTKIAFRRCRELSV